MGKEILFGLLLISTCCFLKSLAAEDPSLILIKYPSSQTYANALMTTSDFQNILMALNGLPTQDVCELFEYGTIFYLKLIFLNL